MQGIRLTPISTYSSLANWDGSQGHAPQASHPPQPVPRENDQENWFRLASPTYNELKASAELENVLGMTFGPMFPAGAREMTPEQAAATEMFRNNLNAFDPSALLRSIGEFGQAFRREGDEVAANNPIHYLIGGQMFLPPGSYTPETVQVIHSHLLDPNHVNNYPSDQDYYAAYTNGQGNTGKLKGEMLYHPGEDRFYGYSGTLDPQSGRPQFFALVNPYDMGKPSGFEEKRPLPDPRTWGHHFINWPPTEPPSPAAPPAT